MVYWNQPYGWRVGEPSYPKNASVADIIRYEREELGNDLSISKSLLDDLQNIQAKHAVWVCRTRKNARRYGNPYKESFTQQAVILTCDHEDEKGYLVLTSASLLKQETIRLLQQEK